MTRGLRFLTHFLFTGYSYVIWILASLNFSSFPFRNLEGVDLKMIMVFSLFVSQKDSFEGCLNSFWWRLMNDDDNEMPNEMRWWNGDDNEWWDDFQKWVSSDNEKKWKWVIKDWKRKGVLKRLNVWLLISWFESCFTCDLNYALKISNKWIVIRSTYKYWFKSIFTAPKLKISNLWNSNQVIFVTRFM